MGKPPGSGLPAGVQSRTELLYSFSDPTGLRIRHVRHFLEVLDIGPAHFIGNQLAIEFLKGQASCR
ncbi:MAG: hypothetical protein HYV08_15325 [Deltaproteobacteria bacterium]|nr:hypothetical protein [Deltaproteobacteria bacterium]MBI3075889.1 hypothetical protein [Deltaproteobacteria bacterium]